MGSQSYAVVGQVLCVRGIFWALEWPGQAVVATKWAICVNAGRAGAKLYCGSAIDQAAWDRSNRRTGERSRSISNTRLSNRTQLVGAEGQG